MKLKNKILIALSPIATLSVVTPTLVACAKSKSYVIEYGQNINCIYKKGSPEEYGKYKSMKTIAKAIKKNSTRAPKGEISVADANSLLTRDGWDQVLYNEIVAGMSICKKQPFTLSDWIPDTIDHQVSMGWSITPGAMQKNNFSATFAYVKDETEPKIYLHVYPSDDTPDIIVQSYIFMDCKVV